MERSEETVCFPIVRDGALHYVSNLQRLYNGKTLIKKMMTGTSFVGTEHPCDVGKELLQQITAVVTFLSCSCLLACS